VKTDFGIIPGKAFGPGQCYYSHDGREHYVRDNFKVLRGQKVTKNVVGPPVYCRTDPPGDYWCGIAHTEYGNVPGKCHEDEMWYGYYGVEYNTKNFSFILDEPEENESTPTPRSPQDTEIPKYVGGWMAAIAKTDIGLIPGKAFDGDCFYVRD
jgi:hypothetical protein